MKYRIANKKRFFCFILTAIICLVLLISTVCNSVSAEGSGHYIEICVQPGDTLWEIAKTYGDPHKDVREVIYKICRINNISAGEIYPGQLILVP